MFTDAYIVINIEPEEMHQIAQLLAENYIIPRPQSASIRNSVLPQIKKNALGVIQLMGITASLVAANVQSTGYNQLE